MENPSRSTARQAGLFSLIGVFNTLGDFTLFWVFLHFLARIPANILSTGIMMAVSFFLNKHLVFDKRGSRGLLAQAVLFFSVTAFGLWVLQTGIIDVLSRPGPFRDLAIWGADLFGLGRAAREGKLVPLAAKAVGTAVSLTWNFVLYKWVVFRKTEAPATGETSPSKWPGAEK